VRALLTLPLPDGQISEDDPVLLAVHETIESWSEDSTYVGLETESFAVYLKEYTDPDLTALETEIAPLVQAWLEGRENHGVTVRMADEASSPHGIQLFTRDAALEGKRVPSLKIVYLEPLELRWGDTK